MNRHRLLTLFAALILTHPAGADEARHRYTCDNGSRLDIAFSTEDSGRPQATLHFADGDVVLPLVPSGSGALYRTDPIRLHTKGNEALFEDGKGNTRRCQQGDTPPTVEPAPPTPNADSFLDVNGRIGYRSRIALPPDAVLIVRIRAAGRTLSEQRYELNGAQLPIPFTAMIDRSPLGKKSAIAVSARIEQGGRLRWTGSKTYSSADLPLNLELKPVTRP